MPRSFEPEIVGFLCNWCSYAGADLAGVSRISYPANLKVIRVMCSGRVDPVMVLEAFLNQADGVLVLGCHLGECHYISGNYQAERKIKMTRKLLQKIGINPNRLHLDWISAAEGERFAKLAEWFTSQVRKLGPLGSSEELKENELKERLVAARQTVENEKVRWMVGKERELMEMGNVYGERVSQNLLDFLMDKNLFDEFVKNRIYLLLEKRALSVKDIARKLGLSPREVLRRIAKMEDRGLIAMTDVEGWSPRYKALKLSE